MLSLQIREGKDFWWKNNKGKYHRLNGPSEVEWNEDGLKKFSEEYAVNGRYHRLNGPAFITWCENGQKECEIYYVNGVKRAHPTSP